MKQSILKRKHFLSFFMFILSAVCLFGFWLNTKPKQINYAKALTGSSDYIGMNYDALQNPKSGQTYLEDAYTYVYFGSYPQTRITDSNLLTSLNNAYAANSGLNAKGYFEFEGEEYKRLVNADEIIDSNFENWSNSNSAYKRYGYYVANNGYDTTSTYWFLVEPIRWRVLSVDESSGNSLLLSDVNLDYISFDVIAQNGVNNDYEGWVNSEYRTWLNNTFLNRAFSSDEKNVINTTTVINSQNTWNSSWTNTYKPEWNKAPYTSDANDKLFALSYQDFLSQSYFPAVHGSQNIARVGINSEYSRARGVYNYTSIQDNGYNNITNSGSFWLRSPGFYTNSTALGYSTGASNSNITYHIMLARAQL